MSQLIKTLIRSLDKQTGRYFWTQEEKEKFAESIVIECINAVYDDGQDAEYYQNRIAQRFNINLID